MNDQPKRLSPDAEFVLDLLVAAGTITREKAFQARDIALEYAPHTLYMSMFTDEAAVTLGQEAAK